MSFIQSAADCISEKVQSAVDWITDKLSRKKYDEDFVEDHVDVDAVLAEFRNEIRESYNA